jgi:hypothetical protein
LSQPETGALTDCRPAIQFALANWAFLDAAILSAHAHPPAGDADYPVPVHVTFVDWIPGLFSLFGLLIVNLIDKDRIKGEEGLGDARAVWRARLFLFIGFAMMAGGLAGSVVRSPLSRRNIMLVTTGAVRPRAQVRLEQLPGAVQILRLRECLPEHPPHALCLRPLDCPEHEQRVRV